MSDIRCTCGNWEQTEEALGRIKESFPIIILDTDNMELRASGTLSGGRMVSLQSNLLCSLPAAILELADKIDPPKSKKREWRTGDELLSSNGNDRYLITRKLSKNQYNVRCIGWGSYAEKLVKNKLPDGWRNLTIEAEQAGEK